MKIIEMIEQMRKSDPQLFKGLGPGKAARLIRGVFKCMNETLSGIEEGVVGYAGLGRFRVRKVMRKGEGGPIKQKQILFHRVEPGKGSVRKPRHIEGGSKR
jgi:hypothetical protein